MLKEQEKRVNISGTVNISKLEEYKLAFNLSFFPKIKGYHYCRIRRVFFFFFLSEKPGFHLNATWSSKLISLSFSSFTYKIEIILIVYYKGQMATL